MCGLSANVQSKKEYKLQIVSHDIHQRNRADNASIVYADPETL